MQKETCVLIHGFTGSPAELKPLGDALAKQGYDIVLPVLAGHCGTTEDLKQSTASAWIGSVEPLVKKLLSEGQSVHLIGFSAGAMIAAILASQYPVQSVVLLAPAVYYIGTKKVFRQIANLIKATWNAKGLSRDYIQSRMEVAAQIPLKSIQQFRRLVILGKSALTKVKQPLCIIQGEKDEVVEPRGAEFARRVTQSAVKELHYLPNSNHLVCRGAESVLVQHYVLDFLSNFELQDESRLIHL